MAADHCSAIAIIEAFDRAVAAVWGDAMCRLWPHPLDKLTADSWIAAGATVPLCEQVFLRIMEAKRDRKQSIPSCLRYFDNPIKDAIATHQAPVEDDPETLRWRARVRGWLTNPKLWMDALWGFPPGHAGCSCPRHVLREMGVT